MTNSKRIVFVGVAIVAILAIGVAIGYSVKKANVVGGGSISHYQKESFIEGLFVGNSRQVNITNTGDISTEQDVTVGDDLTVSGRTATITTSNTATSSLSVGCIGTYATSTLTPVRFVLSSAGTSTATFGAGSANGGVSWQYGTCPI